MYKNSMVIFIWIALNLSVWGKLTSQLSIYWVFQSVNTVYLFIRIFISVVDYSFEHKFCTLYKISTYSFLDAILDGIITILKTVFFIDF